MTAFCGWPTGGDSVIWLMPDTACLQCQAPKSTSGVANTNNAQPNFTRVITYADAVTDSAMWNFSYPTGRGGDLKATIFWTRSAAGAGLQVNWKVGARAYADDDPLNAAITMINAFDLLTATGGNPVWIGPQTKITPDGGPAAGEFITLAVDRDGAADTYNNIAYLLCVRVEFL